MLGPRTRPLPRYRPAHRRTTSGSDHRRLRGAGRWPRKARPAASPHSDPRLARLHRQPRPQVAAASEYQPRPTWLPASQLLARSHLARHDLAPVVVVEEGGRTKESRPAQTLRPRAAFGWMLRRVLRALHRRGPGLGRSVVDRCRGPRLAGGRGAAGEAMT